MNNIWKYLLSSFALALGIPAVLIPLLSMVAPETSSLHNTYWNLSLYALSLTAFAVVSMFAIRSHKRKVDYQTIKEALAESEQKFHAIAEAAQVGVYVIQDGVVKYANRKISEIFGVPFGMLHGRPLSYFLHPDDFPIATERIRRRFAGEDIESKVEYRGIRDSGEEILFVSYVATIQFEGRPAVAGMLVDITRERQMEHALIKSESKYRKLVETTSDAYMFVDRDTTILEVNSALLNMFGYTASEVIGKRAVDFLDEANLSIYQKNSLLSLNKSSTYYELSIRHSDGHNLPVLISTALLRDDQGNPGGAFGLIKDITELKQAQARLESLVKEKEDLMREMHHRTKNNLSVIQSLLSLQSGDISDTKSREALADSGNRIRSISMVHDMLHRTQSLENISTSRYLGDIATSTFQTYLAKGSEIKLELDIEEIGLDIRRIIPLGLIINELVTNSMKYAFRDGRDGLLSVSLSRLDNGMVEVRVKDDGMGLSEGFDAGQATSSFGLKIVNTLVAQLDGTLEARNNHGTEFVVMFSLSGEELPSSGLASINSAAQASGPSQDSGKGKKVLIVDDDHISTISIAHHLSGLGCTATTATNAEDALDLIRRHKFDLIILDIELPRMSGTELARCIRNDNCPSPIFAVTGHDREYILSSNRDLGFMDVIPKPVDLRQLNTLLGQYI